MLRLIFVLLVSYIIGGRPAHAYDGHFTLAAENITNTKVLQFADRAWFEDVAAYRALKADVAKNGLTNKLIEYTEIDGAKYVLRGNGRLSVAEELKITEQLQFKKVELPFQGYRTSADVLEEANSIIHNTPRGPR